MVFATGILPSSEPIVKLQESALGKPAAVPPSHDSDSPPAPPGDDGLAASVAWEEDENRTTLFLRALFTLAAGCLLSWAQAHVPFSSRDAWNRWVGTSVAANLGLPLGIVWLFFAQGLMRVEWLRDQRLNAWSYGWSFREWRRHRNLTLAMFACMLPALVLGARYTTMPAFYREQYLPPVTDTRAVLWLLASLVVYMFCWEWFHRGFLLFGMAQGFGPVAAIVLQAVLFAASHYTKPGLEFALSFAGGLVLGTVAWREKSFAPAFYTHTLIHTVWALLVLF